MLCRILQSPQCSSGIGPTVWIRDQVARKHDFVWPAVRGRRFRSNIINSYKILYAIIRGPIWQEQPIYETKPISHLLSMRARGVLRDRFLSTNCSRVQRRSGIDEARRKSGRHLLSSQERSEDDGRIQNPEDEGRESPAANTGGGRAQVHAAPLIFWLLLTFVQRVTWT